MRHFFRCTVSGQGAPPNWGSIWIMRVRIMCPFPHDLLHSDHWDHSVSSQSMAGKTQMGMSVSHSEIRFGYLLFFEHLDTSLWEMQSRYCYPIFTEEETETLGD